MFYKYSNLSNDLLTYIWFTYVDYKAYKVIFVKLY